MSAPTVNVRRLEEAFAEAEQHRQEGPDRVARGVAQRVVAVDGEYAHAWADLAGRDDRDHTGPEIAQGRRLAGDGQPASWQAEL